MTSRSPRIVDTLDAWIQLEFNGCLDLIDCSLEMAHWSEKFAKPLTEILSIENKLSGKEITAVTALNAL